MNLQASIQYLKGRMEELLIQFPELADDDDFRADVFEGETDIGNVLEKLVNASREASTTADAIKIRMTAQAERKARFERKDEAARSLILNIMDHAALQKFQLPEATLSVRQIAPAPIITDADALPDNCVRIERKPDMKAIKAEVEGGREIPGVAMSNGKSSLTIRTK